MFGHSRPFRIRRFPENPQTAGASELPLRDVTLKSECLLTLPCPGQASEASKDTLRRASGSRYPNLPSEGEPWGGGATPYPSLASPPKFLEEQTCGSIGKLRRGEATGCWIRIQVMGAEG